MAAGNEVTLVGNVTADPELQITPSGVAVARFGLAWNRRFQQDGEWQEEPNFFDITCWKETAENVVESFRKGDRVLVSGRLEHSRWEDRKTGEKRSKVGVVADEVAATTRWATVEVSKVARSDGDRGRSGPDSRSDVDRGRSAPPRKRAPQREESYDNEEPF
jgi:single-strand DNA-binding protein